MSYNVINFKSVAEKLNDLTYTDYFNRLMLIARSIFKWKNLPNNIDEKWIEKYLFTEGACVFFKDPIQGFMIAKLSPDGELNAYDEPTKITPVATNYEGFQLDNEENAVIIRNNDEMIPTTTTIQLYAARLTELSRTIDVNIHAQKTPMLILCNDKQKTTMKNLYKQYGGNEPFIFGSKDLDIEGIKVLKTDAPAVFDKLQIQKHAIWNECMTYLGVNNANMDKRERLVDDEVQANNEQIEIGFALMLKARERACERINQIFNLNISVDVRKHDFMKFKEMFEDSNKIFENTNIAETS